MKKDFLINLALIGAVALAFTLYNLAEGRSAMTPRSFAIGLVLWPVLSYAATLAQRVRAKSLERHEERLRARGRRKP